jgi:hypothetical protein
MTLATPMINRKKHGKPVVNNTPKHLSKDKNMDTEEDARLEWGMDPDELAKWQREKQDEVAYKKHLQQLHLEEQNKTQEKLSEEERLYEEQKRIDDEKQKKRQERLEKIMTLNFDGDDDEAEGTDDDDCYYTEDEEDDASIEYDDNPDEC